MPPSAKWTIAAFFYDTEVACGKVVEYILSYISSQLYRLLGNGILITAFQKVA